MAQHDVVWLPAPNVVETWQHGETPAWPCGPCTAAFVVVSDPAGRILLVEHRRRGADLPGGHLEPGEAPRHAAVRELYEETGVVLTPDRLTPAGTLGCWVQAPRPPDYRYPHPWSHLRVFRARLVDRDLARARPVVADRERIGRRWETVPDVTRLCAGAPWLALLETPRPDR